MKIVATGVENPKIYQQRSRKRVTQRKSDVSNGGNQSQYSVSSINVDLTSIYPANAKNIKSGVMSKEKQERKS